jgi:predicted transcriptional regulator of viral defense system
MRDATDTIYKRFRPGRFVRRSDIAAMLKDPQKTAAAVQWLLESGKGLAVDRGLYYLKSPDEWYRDSIEVNPLLVAANIRPKGIIGYHAALKCYGIAYSESSLFQVAVDKNVRRVVKRFEFQKARYELYRADLTFGVTSSVVDDVRVKHFSRERILLEGLMFPDRFLGMSEFLQSIEGFTWVDLDALAVMVKHYPLVTVSMRLGRLLERDRGRWHVKTAMLSDLEKRRPESRILLVKSMPRGNRLVRRWSLMVPKTIEALGEV